MGDLALYKDEFQAKKEKSCKHNTWRCCGCGKFYDYNELDLNKWDGMVKGQDGQDSWLMLPDYTTVTGKKP